MEADAITAFHHILCTIKPELVLRVEVEITSANTHTGHRGMEGTPWCHNIGGSQMMYS